jgi:hypothetical protein
MKSSTVNISFNDEVLKKIDIVGCEESRSWDEYLVILSESKKQ